MKTPLGFRFSGVACGIKPQRKDLALVFSQVPAVCAGVVTVNAARAAPCIDAAARLPLDGVQALVLNSGNANALTGPAGLEAVAEVHAAAAAALGLQPSQVVSASTGVIGVKLPTQKLVAAMPQLAANLREDPLHAAEAIMTTDTRPKMAHRMVRLGGVPVTVAALAKGSGMVAPQLATVLSTLVTDAAISRERLQEAVRAACDVTFNRLTVDNDMSTNDCVLALANGLAGNVRVEGPGPDEDTFREAVRSLFEELAREVAADGEGSTKRIEVRVTEAPTEDVAEDIARAVAGSALVKAAVFGADPNWGRILATVGARVGGQGIAGVNPYLSAVTIQGICVYDGAPTALDRTGLRARMREPEVRVEVALRSGTAEAHAWGCDLSYDYVKINADYTSLIIERPEGGVGRDDRFANYSPAFKVSTLVQALSYIGRFKGQRCVIQYGGAAMTRESLKRTFCEDVLLLRSVGLLPVVVHGGGPDITRALEKLGTVPEFIDGQRVTNAADLKVVEMVLTGSVNTELVTLLNLSGANAVGLSGKDGALLRAQKLVRQDGKDLGQVGELVEVNRSLLELLLQQNYVPVISPVGMGQNGDSYNLAADEVAAGVAAAIGAQKLIYLADVPGLLEGDELLSELTPEQLKEKVASGAVGANVRGTTDAILRAMSGGVPAVHVIDGRTPHSVIAELFTDKGVGTIVRAEGR